MNSRTFLALCGLAIILNLSHYGCRKQPSPGQAFSGHVTVEGEPLKIGTLTLKPLSREAGPKLAFRIQDGNFQVPAEHGPWPGEFQVRIASIPPELAAMLAGASHEEMAKQAREPHREVSDQFDANSELRMTIQQGEENIGNFDVKWAPEKK